jgi:Lipase (class 3)/FYVE zinc finger
LKSTACDSDMTSMRCDAGCVVDVPSHQQGPRRSECDVDDGILPVSNLNSSLILPPPISWFDDNEVSRCGRGGIDASQMEVLPSSVISDCPVPAENDGNNFVDEDDDFRGRALDVSLSMNRSGSSRYNMSFDETDNRSQWLATVAGSPAASPSWREISQHILPAAAKELLTAAIRRVCYGARWSYALHRNRFLYSDYGNSMAGYFRPATSSTIASDASSVQLPPFSSLPWVDRQMVKEWRSYLPDDEDDETNCISEEDDEDLEFDRARTLVPMPIPRPVWKMADACSECHQMFGPTCLRHHCRVCGGSFCQRHSAQVHKLPQLGYNPNVPERVCDSCKRILLDQNLAERMAWRMARCRDLEAKQLEPYFEVGLDSMDQMVMRITQAALTMAKAIPLGAQATVAVETVDVLRKYGLNGIYTIMLRQEFLAAADMLLKALGINRTVWPLSVHELSAAIFYALAQHRAMRGLYPERENIIHSIRKPSISGSFSVDSVNHLLGDAVDDASVNGTSTYTNENDPALLVPVCDSLSDKELTSLIMYAPIALNFIYVEREVDMQLLAAQQGWRLLYAYLDQTDLVHMKLHDRPASAVFVHEDRKVACLAIRGTSTIHDVITDIRQMPVPFPDIETVTTKSEENESLDDEWTTVFKCQGLAVAGMVGAAINLYREHIDSLFLLAKQGYRIRMTGHSLGGSVAVLLGILVYKDLMDLLGKPSLGSMDDYSAPLRVYSYGTPSCVDLPLAEAAESFVTTVVLHDDVVPRLTPATCRGLLKHLLHIRETWVKDHLGDDIRAFTNRAKTAWAPRWRPGFTLSSTSSVKLKRYYRKHLQYGKSQLRYVKDKLVGDDVSVRSSRSQILDHEEDYPDAASWKSPAKIAEDLDGTSHSQQNEEPPKMVIDFLGGLNKESDGMVVDGDEFFDPGLHLLDTGDDDSDTTNEILDLSMEQCKEVSGEAMVLSNRDNGKDSLSPCPSADPEITDSEDSPGAVVLDEIPLPQMYIPGKIVHIYSHRGVYRASYVPRTFRELRRISLAGNMLSNHKTKSYYDALLEVSNVRRAEEYPPQWTSYDEDDTWYVRMISSFCRFLGAFDINLFLIYFCSACCASRFTWASTSDNEAQEARDKHNCRSCGSLVCDPCSLNRNPVPSIGLTSVVRVCDRCYNDSDGIFVPASVTDTPPIRADRTERASTGDQMTAGKPVRQRQKRSVVVDELAKRVQASGLTCG